MERNPLIVVGIPRKGEGDENTVLDNWRRAVETGIGCVIVDSDVEDEALTRKVSSAGGYVYVPPKTPDYLIPNYQTESGAERVAVSVNQFDRFYNHDIIINVHARLPELSGDLIKALMYPLANMDVDIATLVTNISDEDLESSESVKAHVEWIERNRVHILTGSRAGQIKKFSRKKSDFSSASDIYRHVPIYAYKRASLDRFVRFEPTSREMEERLEPHRALSNGMRVDAVMAENI